MSSAIENQEEVVEEDIRWMVAEEDMLRTAAECTPVVEVALGQIVYRVPGDLEPDSPWHTYIACRHCHISSGLPTGLQRPGHSPLQFPQRHRSRLQIQ